MADLVILVPSRGRPGNIARLTDACKRTCRANTLLHFGLDDDDARLHAGLDAAGGNSMVSIRPRMGLAAWTNELASHHLHPKYLPASAFLASLGDDMVPVTDGWDVRLMEACGPAGMAYPNDRRRDDIPEAIVMTSSIVRALGWMCQPGLDHWFVDAVWRDIGNAVPCLTYLPGVIVEHRHPNVPGGDPPDATYSDAAKGFGRDMAAYQKWRLASDGMRADIAKVRAVVNDG